MKQILQNKFVHIRKKIRYNTLAILFLLFILPFSGYTQCASGYIRDTINWDNLDYLHKSTAFYNFVNSSTGLNFVTTPMQQTQYFELAGTKMTMATTIPVGGATQLWGDVITHTGETGAYGTGEDIYFIKSGTGAVTITLTFANEVRNLKFSVFDIDQEITFAPTATNTAGTAQSITLTKPAGAASLIPLTATYPSAGANITTVTGTVPAANWTTGGGSGTAYANTSANGTINVDIAGPVKTVVLTFLNDGNTNDFFVSDISACVPQSYFPTNYYSPYTQPFINQPAYFLSNPQNLHVYMVNPVTAVSEYIFSETAGTKMNSLAYDPVNHWLYYVMDNSSAPQGNLSLKKYDFNTEPGTISTVIPNLATFGIPGFFNGVELAGAAFYNGSLYLGIEGLNAGTYTGIEAIVWKINFDGAGNATDFSQVFATQGAGTGSPIHDWGDIIIRDSILITHASIGTSPVSNQYIHYNLQTGNAITYSGNVETAGQLGQTWNGTLYRINNSVATYNNNGSIGALTSVTTTSCSPAWVGHAGDASDPFKPKGDFGDAPASYDPVALSPAVHQKHCNNDILRLGTAWDREWSKNTSVNASGDATDEDGIGTVTILNSNGITYNHVQRVSVTNNTGANATIGGWIDFDVDGVFEASEGIIMIVPSTASGTQNIDIVWPGVNIPSGTPTTFLRIRLVSGSTAMTASDATGWYDDGEVEDYPLVNSNIPLSINLLDFNATVTKDKNVELKWSAINDNDASGFDIQRSINQNDWKTIGWKAVSETINLTNYDFTDLNPVEGKSYYRLRLVEKNGSSKFSNTKQIYIDVLKNKLTLAPNPVQNTGSILFSGNVNTVGVLKIRSLSGQTVFNKSVAIGIGENRIPLEVNSLKPGIYMVELITKEKIYTNKLSVLR